MWFRRPFFFFLGCLGDFAGFSRWKRLWVHLWETIAVLGFGADGRLESSGRTAEASSGAGNHLVVVFFFSEDTWPWNGDASSRGMLAVFFWCKSRAIGFGLSSNGSASDGGDILFLIFFFWYRHSRKRLLQQRLENPPEALGSSSSSLAFSLGWSFLPRWHLAASWFTSDWNHASRR